MMVHQYSLLAVAQKLKMRTTILSLTKTNAMIIFKALNQQLFKMGHSIAPYLLQEQQAILQSIIAKQEKFEAFQSHCEQMVEDLEKKVATQCPTSASSSDSSPAGNKRKRVVYRDLSVSTIHVLRGLFLDYNRNLKGSMNLHFQNMVAVVHKSLEKQFKADERYVSINVYISTVPVAYQIILCYIKQSSTSPHNTEVREMIMSELTKNPNCKFSGDIIKGTTNSML